MTLASPPREVRGVSEAAAAEREVWGRVSFGTGDDAPGICARSRACARPERVPGVPEGAFSLLQRSRIRVRIGGWKSGSRNEVNGGATGVRMKEAEVRRQIYALLKPVFSDYGFRLKRKDEEGFVRSTPWGRQAVGIPLWDYNPAFEFSLVISIRIDAVEAIIHQFSGSPAKYHDMSFTYIGKLDDFLTAEQSRVTVTTEDDIRVAVSRLDPIVRERIIPFLDKHQDVKSLDSVMNQNGVPDRLNNIWDAIYPIVVARQAGNSRFVNLVEEYRRRVEVFPPPEREKFDQMAAYLVNCPDTNKPA